MEEREKVFLVNSALSCAGAHCSRIYSKRQVIEIGVIDLHQSYCSPHQEKISMTGAVNSIYGANICEISSPCFSPVHKEICTLPRLTLIDLSLAQR
jgi:hypothetical protein